MARKSKVSASDDVPSVDPSLVTVYPLPVGTVLHRIHQSKYGPVEFNSSKVGNARFSPIQTPAGDAIPTMYAGENFDCAAMETIYHDVPIAPGLKTLDQGKLVGQVHSVFITREELRLADLRTKALRKLGLQRTDLIDTEKDQYPKTRVVGVDIYARRADVQGLLWTSRQDDSAKALVLFGDRIGPDALLPVGSSRDLVVDEKAYDEVVELGERIGVLVVTGK